MAPASRIVLALIAGLVSCGAPPPATAPAPASTELVPVTHGVMAGDADQESVLIWSRTNRHARMNVLVEGQAAPISQLVGSGDDFTGSIAVANLEPGEAYRYWVWFTNAHAEALADPNPPPGATPGAFRTAPSSDTAAEVRFTFGGDLAGQNVCRDADAGFPLFEVMSAVSPDFFVGLGDMMYADDVCTETGKANNRQVPLATGNSANLSAFWDHWRYTRADPAFAKLLAGTVYYASWDDHEVVNDFGPHHDTRAEPPYVPGVPLLPIGRRAFFDYNPIRPHPEDEQRIYRSYRWGKHVELFILDTRQYRDRNSAPDAPDKSLLGAAQKKWLVDGVTQSTATWKVVASSVTIALPGGNHQRGRDGWSGVDHHTGFEHELRSIFEAFAAAGTKNHLWLSADVHHAAVYRHAPISGLVVHELVSGPLGSEPFRVDVFDESWNSERLFDWAPPDEASKADFENLTRWFNFGMVGVQTDGTLRVEFHNARGERVHRSSLAPER